MTTTPQFAKQKKRLLRFFLTDLRSRSRRRFLQMDKHGFTSAYEKKNSHLSIASGAFKMEEPAKQGKPQLVRTAGKSSMHGLLKSKDSRQAWSISARKLAPSACPLYCEITR